MTTPAPKTVEEHRDYLYQIVRLQLFFLHRWLAAHPGEAPVDVLRKRVDIYRKTDANPGGLNPTDIDWNAPAWQSLEQALLCAYDGNRQDAAAFEQEGFGILRASIDARVERDFHDQTHLDRYQCGSLRYDVHDASCREVMFHIANRISPTSIFAHPLYLPCCFMVLLEHVEANYRAEVIGTHSWLNSNPKWMVLFPQEWTDNLGEPSTDVQWHYGYWGQFITARGTFNEKLGDYVRQHGTLKYPPRGSKCAIANLRRHLIKKYFSAG